MVNSGMMVLQSPDSVEKHAGGGGWDVDLPANLGDGEFFLKKALFQQIRDWQKAGDPNFGAIMINPVVKYAFEAVLNFKADRADDGPAAPASFAPVSNGARAPLGAVKPVGLKPLITHPSPQAAPVSSFNGRPSAYTHASTSTTSLEIIPAGLCTIRDLTFSTSAADARLVTVTLNQVPIFSAGSGSGDGILLSELTSQNTRGAFLAGHEIGPESAQRLKLTFALPNTATIRAMCEHDATVVACAR